MDIPSKNPPSGEAMSSTATSSANGVTTNFISTKDQESTYKDEATHSTTIPQTSFDTISKDKEEKSHNTNIASSATNVGLPAKDVISPGSNVSPPATNVASPGTNEEDHDFEPSADVMVHDYDDERTMEEEENYESDEDDVDELADLNRESDMPLEQLLAAYGGGQSTAQPMSSPNRISIFEKHVSTTTDADENGEKRSLRSAGTFANSMSDSSDDDDYESPPSDDWKKKPRIGDDFQVHSIPSVEALIYSDNSKDAQVWNPNCLSNVEVENFLREISYFHKQDNKLPSGSHTPDNEDALLLLKQCNNDAAEALRRYKSRPKPALSELNIWSEEECMQFEVGLAIYGKDFLTIHQNKVKTKSVRDIVKFYYIWKKTERYDYFSAKTRLGKKKEPLHPGVTDYMERLLDENEQLNQANHNANSNDIDLSAAPHTNALREYIRTNYNNSEFANFTHLPYGHLEEIQHNEPRPPSNRHYMENNKPNHTLIQHPVEPTQPINEQTPESATNTGVS